MLFLIGVLRHLQRLTTQHQMLIFLICLRLSSQTAFLGQETVDLNSTAFYMKPSLLVNQTKQATGSHCNQIKCSVNFC